MATTNDHEEFTENHCSACDKPLRVSDKHGVHESECPGEVCKTCLGKGKWCPGVAHICDNKKCPSCQGTGKAPEEARENTDFENALSAYLALQISHRQLMSCFQSELTRVRREELGRIDRACEDCNGTRVITHATAASEWQDTDSWLCDESIHEYVDSRLAGLNQPKEVE